MGIRAETVVCVETDTPLPPPLTADPRPQPSQPLLIYSQSNRSGGFTLLYFRRLHIMGLFFIPCLRHWEEKQTLKKTKEHL